MRKYEVTINNTLYSVLVKKYTASDAELEINGKPYMVKLDEPITSIPFSTAPSINMFAPPLIQTATASSAPAPVASTPVEKVSSGAGAVTAPIPGSILDICVKVGDSVSEGQTVIKMEAMKMENDINTTIAGTVQSISVSVGDAVNQGQDLIIIG